MNIVYILNISPPIFSSIGIVTDILQFLAYLNLLYFFSLSIPLSHSLSFCLQGCTVALQPACKRLQDCLDAIERGVAKCTMQAEEESIYCINFR